METLPATEFGRTLRALIREQYPTQQAYARRLNLDPSRITQLLKGKDERPTYPLLQALMAGFDQSDSQQRLYEAWLASYAPSPIDQAIPEPWAGDEEIQQFSWQMYGQVPAGKSLLVFQSLWRLWHALEPDPRRFLAALMVGRTLCEISFDLDRPFVGLNVCQRMLAIAQAAFEPEWIAISWWLKSLAYRLSFPEHLDRADGILADLAAYLQQWQPAPASLARHAEMTQSVKRDALLVGWSIATAQGGGNIQDLLTMRLRTLHDDLRKQDEPLTVGLAHEAISRVQIALGQLDASANSLTMGRNACSDLAPHNQMKFHLSDLRLRIAANDGRNLWDRYSASLDIADQNGLVHYRRQLHDLQDAIERVAS